mgnify:CR=1 FL=1|tara:strand:+ start:669 stop:923 length:255 start_codon:yes stop_codon:yes gene_type:complete
MSEAKFEINCGIKYEINLFDVVRSGEPCPQKVIGDGMSNTPIPQKVIGDGMHYIMMKPIYHENKPITFVPIDNNVKNIECVRII